MKNKIEAEGQVVEVPFGDEQPDQWPSYREDSLFWSAVVEAAAEVQVPREMAMMCAFGAISIAGQGLTDVKMPTDHEVQTPLMLLTLAESGERKTTIQNLFFKSIIKMNRTSVEVSDQLREKFSDEVMIWKVEEKAAKSRLFKALKDKNEEATSEARQSLKQIQDNKPVPPAFPRLLYDDTTPHALVQHLYDNSPHGGMLTSEANSIFSGRALQDLDKLNTLWDGGDVIVDRLTRPSFVLSGARLTLALMTQPSVIERFLSKRGEEARGMGFLARFLVAKPGKMAGTRITRPLSPLPALDHFNERIKEILTKKTFPHLYPDEAPPTIKVLTFSSEASVLWKRYDQGIENAMKDGQPYYYYTDHASKIMDNVTRMAALLHYFEGYEAPISSETLTFCYDVARKCSTHFQRYLAGEPQVVSDANALAKHLLEQADKEGQKPYASSPDIPKHLALGRCLNFSLTDLKQRGPYRLRGRENDMRLREALHLLEKVGHVGYNTRQNHYVFRENILSSSNGPELRNGIEYRIESLPFFTHQEYHRDPHPNYYSDRSGFYLTKPEHLAP